MTITARVYIEASSPSALSAAVAAAILADVTPTPVGEMTYGGGVWVQAMDAGTAPGSIETVQTDVATLRVDVDELYSAKAAPTPITADGAITIANRRYVITKAGVAALTLAAPTSEQAGTTIEIISRTANAHVITSTDLLNDGVTGGAKDTATFAAFVGANITLIADNLQWTVLSTRAVTIAAV